jgi:hypothetical protein
MRISGCGPQDPEIPFFPSMLIYLIFLVLISNRSGLEKTGDFHFDHLIYTLVAGTWLV